MSIPERFQSHQLIWLLTCILILSGCNEEVPNFPIVEATLIEATEEGAQISVRIENYPINSASAIGILWSTSNENLNLEDALSIQIPASEFSNGEGTVLVSTLRTNIPYRLRAFVETDNNRFYSPIIDFLSLGSKPPVLEQMNPTTGKSGDTLSLIVKEFGIDPTANQVAFNESFAEIISKDDSLWKVIVPVLPPSDPFFQTGEVDVFVTKYNLTSNSLPFDLQNFKITGTLPETLKAGEIYPLVGEGFVPTRTKVSFNGSEVGVIVESETLIQIFAPSLFETATGKFTVTAGVIAQETNEVTIAGPTFDSDNFTAIIGPRLPYEISGTNLDNPNLELLINDVEVDITSREANRINFTIPDGLCTETVQIDARIRTGVKTLATDLPFASPEISSINVLEAAYGGKMEVTFRHVPLGHSVLSYINDERVISRNFRLRSDGQFTVDYEIPTDLRLNDAGDLNFSYEICGKTITSNQFAQIPPPEITNIGIINPYQFTTMNGRGFNGDQRGIYINDEKKEVTFSFRNRFTDENLDTELGFLLGEQSDGTFDLSVEINGRRSENISVTVENLWTPIARMSDVTTLPDAAEIHPVAFLNGDELYVGGGFDGFTAFYALDLNSGNWDQKADIPMQTGGSSNNEDAGYLFHEQQFYRYDFAADTWERLPDQENVNGPFITGYTSFMADGRFFISPGCRILYYYDPVVNEWQKIEGGSNSGCSNAVTFTSQTGERYVYNYRTIETFDPSTLTYTGGWFLGFSDFGYRNSSLQGFEYEGNLILIDNNRITVTAIGGRTHRSFGLPNYMNNPKLFRRGDEAIVVSEGIVWTFDLTAI